MTRKLVMLVLLLITIQVAKAEEWYVNPNKGNDANPGTKTQPLKTLREAAMRVNANKYRETTTLILSEGVYLLTETVLFINDKYTRENRLVIRAEYRGNTKSFFITFELLILFKSNSDRVKPPIPLKSSLNSS